MRLLAEMVVAMGGMGLTTVGVILLIEQQELWPVIMLLIGVPLLWFSAECIDADR